MQVILLEKLQNVGDLGDVVKVKQGFARNFLIPQGKAKRATPENIKLLEAKRAELEKAAGAKLAHAQEQAAKIEGLKIQVTQKAGVDGRLFGSVTNVDIVEALRRWVTRSRRRWCGCRTVRSSMSVNFRWSSRCIPTCPRISWLRCSATRRRQAAG